MIKENDFEIQIKKITKRISKLDIFAWVFVILGFIVLAIGLYYWKYVENTKFNEVGDFIGGVAGSLWALAGLFFIYIAFLGQKVEIKYQQEDLTLTREELKETKEVFKQQSQIMSNQQIDNTFFNLLDNHRKLVEGFVKKGFNEATFGYEALDSMSAEIKKYFNLHSKVFKSKMVFEYSYGRDSPIDMISEYTNLEILHTEVKNILQFISKKADVGLQSFYYNTLSVNLTLNEKFLIEAYDFMIKNDDLIYDFGCFKKYNYTNLKTKIFHLESTNNSVKLTFDKNSSINYPVIDYSLNDASIQKVMLFENNKLDLLEFKENGNKIFDLFNDLILSQEEIIKKIFRKKNANSIYYNYIYIQFKMNNLFYFIGFESTKSGSTTYSLRVSRDISYEFRKSLLEII